MGIGQSTFPSLPSYVPPEQAAHPPIKYRDVVTGAFRTSVPEGYKYYYEDQEYRYIPRPPDNYPWSYTWDSRLESWTRYNTNLGPDIPSFEGSAGRDPTDSDPKAGSAPWQGGGPGTPGWSMPGSGDENTTPYVPGDPTDTFRRYPQSFNPFVSYDVVRDVLGRFSRRRGRRFIWRHQN